MYTNLAAAALLAATGTTARPLFATFNMNDRNRLSELLDGEQQKPIPDDETESERNERLARMARGHKGWRALVSKHGSN